MTSIADGSVSIQTSSASIPSTPSWFGEVVLLAAHLRKHGVLSKVSERVRFARRRFGRYDVIDFFVVLFGYAISGERTLEAFYERLQPFAISFMALFERDHLPARSTLSRFLAALTEVPIESLHTLFLDDLLSRPLTNDANERQTGGLVDPPGNAWVVFDLDGTREAARQRVLPQTEDLPPAFRRFDDVCAPGYRGRKRGEVVRTRTVISQAHSFHWLGSFGNRGNGRYREELRQGLAAIGRYLAAYQLPQAHALLRLDGQYGTGAALSDLSGFAFVTRGKDYTVLDHPLVQARLHLPPDQSQQRPESQMVRSLYDCESVPVGSEGVRCRVIVATHPAGKKKSPVGVTRAGIVYELFFTMLPQQGFTTSDVVELYLHRGAFEPTLSDEDQEIDPDRWCSHSAWGQEAWQCVAQWVWNLRLELGHQLHPDPVRTTEFAPVLPPPPPHTAPSSGYAPAVGGLSMEGWSFLGQRFHAPTRRDASLSSKPAAECSGATPRSRWEPTRGVCRQHSQLPSLSAARAMSMEWQCHGEAAPGQRSPASPQRRRRAAPLARLESQSSSTCVHPTPASPTGGGTKGTGHHSQSSRPVFASFQSIPGAFSALLGRAPGT